MNPIAWRYTVEAKALAEDIRAELGRSLMTVKDAFRFVNRLPIEVLLHFGARGSAALIANLVSTSVQHGPEECAHLFTVMNFCTGCGQEV